jgi:argininosuccinate lyase
MVGTKATWQLVQIMQRMLEGLEVHEDRLAAACVPELYATDVVLQKVLEGGNFRDSYKDIGLHLENVEAMDPVKTIRNRTSLGTTGNLGLDEDGLFVRLMVEGCEEVLHSYEKAYENLCEIEGVQAVLY